MSRSRKKYPGYCDSNPYMKTYYNRCIRRSNKLAIHKNHEKHHYIPSGRSFKKANCSYDICDWKWIQYTEQEFRTYLGTEYVSERYKYQMK